MWLEMGGLLRFRNFNKPAFCYFPLCSHISKGEIKKTKIKLGYSKLDEESDICCFYHLSSLYSFKKKKKNTSLIYGQHHVQAFPWESIFEIVYEPHLLRVITKPINHLYASKL